MFEECKTSALSSHVIYIMKTLETSIRYLSRYIRYITRKYFSVKQNDQTKKTINQNKKKHIRKPITHVFIDIFEKQVFYHIT